MNGETIWAKFVYVEKKNENGKFAERMQIFLFMLRCRMSSPKISEGI